MKTAGAQTEGTLSGTDEQHQNIGSRKCPALFSGHLGLLVATLPLTTLLMLCVVQPSDESEGERERNAGVKEDKREKGQ